MKYFLFIIIFISLVSIAFADTNYIWREAETAYLASFPLKTATAPTLSEGIWLQFNQGDDPDAVKNYEMIYKFNADKAGE